MDVVIVESPTKAKTINKYLGKGYEVYASFGHIRDLPSKDGSVDPDQDFAMVWDFDSNGPMGLFGKAFLDRLYVVLDFETLKVGLAPLRENLFA